MSFLTELRRRNVLRMAGLYAVCAWLIVQVAETLLPIFETPGWVLKTLVVLLVLGAVPALVFSWLFELTPDGLKRDTGSATSGAIAGDTARRMDRLMVAGLLVLLALIAATRFWPEQRTAPMGETPASTSAPAIDAAGAMSAAAPPRNSIAVLPFVNMSADRDNEYFSDGISEELLNVLVKVEGLNVTSRTSSFAYKGRDLSTTAIGAELKVAHVLEGSVRKSGNRVRITAQLIDAGDDRHLWSDTFDRELTDIFAIQDEIANAIVTALRETLGGQIPVATVEVRADTDNVDAYALYLKARELFIARSDLEESIRLFERAVAIDPQFARAWEGLAAVSSVATSWGLTGRDYRALARSAAEHALTLDPALSMPWAVLAMVAKGEWPTDFTDVMKQFDRALQVDPRNSTALLWRGIAWIELGFFERAVADLDQCLALEPGYHNCRRHKALAVLSSGDESRAIALFEESLVDGFVTSRAEHFVGPLLRRGDTAAALLLLDAIELPVPLRAPLVASLRGEPTDLVQAQALVERHLPAPGHPFYSVLGLTWLYLWAGDFDRAAAEDDSITTSIVYWERYPAGFRNTPAFVEKLTRAGMLTYWKAHGFPPQCRATGTSFECDGVQP
jgi:TolB-like protein/Flp pilus assembly protein TadD